MRGRTPDSIWSTPVSVPTIKVSHSPMKKPVSSTPAMHCSSRSSDSGSSIWPKRAIDDLIAAVGLVERTVSAAPDRGGTAELLQAPLGVSDPDRADLDGKRGMRAEPFDAFVARDHCHAMVGGERDDLLAQQGAAAPLDHSELGVDLVGAVEIDVEIGDGVQVPDRYSETACEPSGFVAGRNRRDLQAFLFDPLCQPADHQGRRSSPSRARRSSHRGPRRRRRAAARALGDSLDVGTANVSALLRELACCV